MMGKIFRSTGISVFDYQAKVHRSDARFRVFNGGRRIGKSKLGGHEAFAQCVIPGSYIWIVGPTMDLAEKEFRTVWRYAVELGFIPYRRKSERELFIQFENGSHIECRSEENPDQLIGEGLDFVVLAEAARLKERTWHQYVRPALADRQGRALFSSTPRGFNWFHKFYLKGQNRESDTEDNAWWESWTVPSRLNPILPKEEIDEAQRNSTPESFAQEWEAKFIAYGGLVFSEFDENIHVRAQNYNSLLRTQLWCDPGSTAPYAVLLVQITPDEQITVLDEIYVTHKTSAQVIAIAESKWRPYILDDFGNPRNDLKVVVDKAAAEAVATWRLRGYQTLSEKPTNIAKGIEVHHMFLRDPLRSTDDVVVPRITYSPLCINAIKEHNLYHYPDDARKRVETSPTDRPVDVDNHTIDATRYGYFNNFPELFNELMPMEIQEYGDWESLIPGLKSTVSLGFDDD